MSTSDTEPEWRELKIPGLMGAIGPLLARRDGDSFAYGMHMQDHHANAVGLVHGGVLASIADQVMSMVAWELADRKPVVTVTMNMNFLSAARPGDFVTAVAKPQLRQTGTVFMESTLWCAERAIASATAVLKIKSPKPKGDAA